VPNMVVWKRNKKNHILLPGCLHWSGPLTPPPHWHLSPSPNSSRASLPFVVLLPSLPQAPCSGRGSAPPNPPPPCPSLYLWSWFKSLYSAHELMSFPLSFLLPGSLQWSGRRPPRTSSFSRTRSSWTSSSSWNWEQKQHTQVRYPNTARYSTVWYSTVQYSTVRTVQYSTVVYCTVLTRLVDVRAAPETGQKQHPQVRAHPQSPFVRSALSPEFLVRYSTVLTRALGRRSR